METTETHTNGSEPNGLIASDMTIATIIKNLSKKLPDRLLKTRKQGGTSLTYIEWHTAVKTLDFYAANRWTSEVRSVDVVGDRVTVTVRITIHAEDGSYYREATGTEYYGDKHKGFGEPVTNAEAQAFKRSAAKFGLGLYLYDKG